MSLFDLTGLGGVATAASDATKAITDLIARFIPDPDKKLEAETAARQILADSQKAQWQAMSAVMTADSASDSKFTKNARPTVVYWSLTMVTAIAAAGLFGHAKPIIDALSQVPPELYDMIKYGVGIFAAGRSTEKVATVIASAIKRK